jgi:hypothetical protein
VDSTYQELSDVTEMCSYMRLALSRTLNLDVRHANGGELRCLDIVTVMKVNGETWLPSDVVQRLGFVAFMSRDVVPTRPGFDSPHRKLLATFPNISGSSWGDRAILLRREWEDWGECDFESHSSHTNCTESCPLACFGK